MLLSIYLTVLEHNFFALFSSKDLIYYYCYYFLILLDAVQFVSVVVFVYFCFFTL